MKKPTFAGPTSRPHTVATEITHLAIAYAMARDAMHLATSAMIQATPRIWQYDDASDYTAASEEHRRRLNCLRGLISDMEALAEHCRDCAQEDGR